MGIKGDLLALIKFFLFERQQRVVLNRQESEWLTINAGVPQDSTVCPIYIKYIYNIYIHIYIVLLVSKTSS